VVLLIIMIKLFELGEYTVSADQRQYVLNGKGVTRYLKNMTRVFETIKELEDKKIPYANVDEYIRAIDKNREAWRKDIEKALQTVDMTELRDYWEDSAEIYLRNYPQTLSALRREIKSQELIQ